MQRYILGRLLRALISLWGVSLIVFLAVRASGDPATILLPLEQATREDYQRMKKALGLDRPLHVQYGIFISRAVRGDTGRSFRWGEPAMKMVLKRLPATLQLAGAAFVLAGVAGITIGVLSATRPGTFFDGAGKLLALLGQSAPSFWVGLILILVFAVNLNLLPSSGRGDIRNLIMPAITLGWYSTAALMRLTRSSMLSVLDTEYIKMARIKGLPERMVILKHAFKNGAIPVITLMGLQLAALLQGSVITETIFAWPGMGRLAIDAISSRDFPIVQTVVLLGSAIFILANLLVDISYAYLDPRIRYH